MTLSPHHGLLTGTRLHIAATAYSVCCIAIGAAVGLVSLEPTPARARATDHLADRIERLEQALLTTTATARRRNPATDPYPDRDAATFPGRPAPRPARVGQAAPTGGAAAFSSESRRRDHSGGGDILPALAIAGDRPNPPSGRQRPANPGRNGHPEPLANRELDATVAGQAAPTGAPSGGRGEIGDDEPDPELNALNRVLVEAGGLLLRPWAVEVQPASTFSYRGASALLIAEEDGRRVALAQDVKSTTIENAITGRVGLPADFQAEVRVPQRTQREKISAGSNTDSRQDSGLGDVEVALAHQFIRETAGVPDLIGEVRYKAPTGDDAFGEDGGLPMGSGFHALSGSLTAAKSFDPVVFLAKVGYTETFEDTKQGFTIEPGSKYSFASGTVLAAGPGVSLRTLLALDFTEETSVDGQRIDGSDLVEGVLQLGAAAAISDKTLLDFGVNIGVTDDAPDIGMRLATSYRF